MHTATLQSYTEQTKKYQHFQITLPPKILCNSHNLGAGTYTTNKAILWHEKEDFQTGFVKAP